ncbi:Cof-type HAD-IIB family hydrolase [Spiroplasma diminutum]|uniref:HAD-superfamily hydrolase n=1 Tax=Spiroplasma diminutum CUAS-1 TaxID=1276221 RepID=S5MDE6_9MOLU|nr:Cof-type HAD-IIB family hydrolase [Spiroplasma diminutum]AGR41743.1 HAD-superfamily hydrolase [Spiroplasma diminutum CUAS-1]
MKWWFSDYDGTINLKHNNYIDPRDLDFIKRWIKDGNKFAIATGRMEHEIRPVLESSNIPYDYMICNNGAVIYDKENGILESASIPMESRKDIIELFDTLKDEYILGYCLKDQRMGYSRVEVEEIYSNPFLNEYATKENNFEKGNNDILNSPDLNLLYFFVAVKDIEKVKKIIDGKIKGCKAVRTHQNVIEIMREDVSKAYGIKILQEINNFSLEDVYTSGDGENDIEMLELTNNSFAMRNHQTNVDKAAKYIIDNVYEIEKIKFL